MTLMVVPATMLALYQRVPAFPRWDVRYLGRGGTNIVTRLMGLILAVIGVQMLIEGGAGAIAAS